MLRIFAEILLELTLVLGRQAGQIFRGWQLKEPMTLIRAISFSVVVGL